MHPSAETHVARRIAVNIEHFSIGEFRGISVCRTGEQFHLRFRREPEARDLNFLRRNSCEFLWSGAEPGQFLDKPVYFLRVLAKARN